MSRSCPSGRHVMDPGWQSCPYCASESSRRGETTHASSPETGESGQAVSPLPEPPAGQRQATVFGDAGARRVVGVLATYTWRPEGEIFPVREGRNLLGSDPACEIRVTTDPRVSARHACIIHRPDGFWIYDEKSMNGTYVDGTSVEAQPGLPESAVIRTGGTLWRFVALQPPQET